MAVLHVECHYWSDWIDIGEWIANFSLFHRNQLPLHSRRNAPEIGSGRVELDLYEEKDWRVNRTDTEELELEHLRLYQQTKGTYRWFILHTSIFFACFYFPGPEELVDVSMQSLCGRQDTTLDRLQGPIETNIYACGHSVIPTNNLNVPNNRTYVFGLWEENRVQNQCMQWKNTQIPQKICLLCFYWLISLNIALS